MVEHHSFLKLFFLLVAPVSPPSPPQNNVHPLGGPPGGPGGGATNIPAYVWMPLIVPTNAVSMVFAYKIQGDWKDDSLAAALNGTNVLF